MTVRPGAVATIAAGILLGVSGTIVLALSQQPGKANDSKKADPEAYSVLKKADEMRQTLPATFAGVSGDVKINDNGVVSTGRFSYVPKKGTELTVASIGKEAETWAKEGIGSSFSHRLHGDFDRDTGSQPLTLASDDGSPIGRKVLFHDNFQSTDRVRDNQIVEVDRTMGKTHFIITVMDTVKTDEGKYLPSQFVVTYFDSTSGAIERTECFTDGFAKIEGAWLPTSRRVVTLSGGKSSARTFELSNLHLAAISAK
jgi:Protein of unknown function (DUF3386).